MEKVEESTQKGIRIAVSKRMVLEEVENMYRVYVPQRKDTTSMLLIMQLLDEAVDEAFAKAEVKHD